MNLVNWFLRLKHWQLFLIMFGVPFVAQLFVMGYMTRNIGIDTDPDDFFGVFYIFPLVISVSMFGMLGWMWSVGVGLQKHLPPRVHLKVHLFKGFLGFAIIYMALFIVIFLYLVSEIHSSVENNTIPNISIFAIIPILFIFHLFAMFCMGFAMYFNAKTYRSIELGKMAHFENYIGYFFLFWFSFVGVWIMQPTINQLVDGTYEPPENHPAPEIDDAPDLLD